LNLKKNINDNIDYEGIKYNYVNVVESTDESLENYTVEKQGDIFTILKKIR
jgi:hypothetical protein